MHEGCGRQGTSGMYCRVFQYLIYVSVVKWILLLALKPSRTAIDFLVWVIGRTSGRGKGPPRGRGQSLSVDRSVWVTGSRSVTLDRGDR